MSSVMPAAKRFKSDVIDLTALSDESDDDIVITNVRSVNKKNNNNNNTTTTTPLTPTATPLNKNVFNPGGAGAGGAVTSTPVAAHGAVPVPPAEGIFRVASGSSSSSSTASSSSSSSVQVIGATQTPSRDLSPQEFRAQVDQLYNPPPYSLPEWAERLSRITPMAIKAIINNLPDVVKPMAEHVVRNWEQQQHHHHHVPAAPPKQEPHRPIIQEQQQQQHVHQPKVPDEIVEPKLEGVQFHGNGSIEVAGRFYNNERDLATRSDELRNKVSKLERYMMQMENRKKERPAKQVQIKNERDNLIKLLGSNNPKVVKLNEQMKKLSDESKVDYERYSLVKQSLEKSKKKYQHFINNQRPQIIKAIQFKIQKQRREAELKRAKLADIQRQQQLFRQKQQLKQTVNRNTRVKTDWGVPLVGGGTRLSIDVGDEDEDEFDEDIDNGTLRLIQDLRNQRERESLMSNPLAINAYTHREDLVHLLESVKKQEDEEIEGESNTPDLMTINLLKHQRIGLHWLEAAEDDKKKRGGILGDAMGLGKTVQMIALMLSHRFETNEEEDVDDYSKVNLVVAPVSLINQWKRELETRVKEAANLNIFMYHQMNGSKRPSFQQLRKYDVVLTSYGTLASELKKHCKIPGLSEEELKLKEPPNMNKINQLKNGEGFISPFFEEESNFYRVILDESQQIKNKFTRGSVACSTLKSLYRWCLSGTPMQNNVDELYPLIRFLRIKPYCFEGNFRADISRPLQIKSDNYDEYDREKSMNKIRLILKSIMLRREKDSKIDGKPILDIPKKHIRVESCDMATNDNELSFYQSIELSAQKEIKRILNGPIAKGDYSYIFTMLLRLRQACLNSELVRIGDRKLGVVYDDEGNVISTANVDSMMKNAEKLRLEVVNRINNTTDEDSETKFLCPVCLEPQEEQNWAIFYPCGHGLCKECCSSFFEQFQEDVGGNNDERVRQAKCTTCRLLIKENDMIDYDVFDKLINKKQGKEMIKIAFEHKQKQQKQNIKETLKVDNLECSPKIYALLELLKKIWSNDPNDKVILFSHFTTFFFILQKFLSKEKIEALHYVGSMNATARNNCVKDFYNDPNKKLMLISLKAGNSGLTLTCANHVVIMDPFWNPYVEYQAQDRVHRIGQTKEVHVYRMLTAGTVEDRILELQEKKKEVIESAMDPSGMKQVSSLSREDIARLFNLN